MKSKIELFVSEKVKAKRNEKSFSQAALAKLLGLSKGFIGQAESLESPTKYNLNHLNELSRIFDCSMSEFFPEGYLQNNLAVKSVHGVKEGILI